MCNSISSKRYFQLMAESPKNLEIQFNGWGGRIRTYDQRFRAACLTTWLHPNKMIPKFIYYLI